VVFIGRSIASYSSRNKVKEQKQEHKRETRRNVFTEDHDSTPSNDRASFNEQLVSVSRNVFSPVVDESRSF